MSNTKKGLHFTEEITYSPDLTIQTTLDAIDLVYGSGKWTHYGPIFHHLMGDIGIRCILAETDFLDISDLSSLENQNNPQKGPISFKNVLEFMEFRKFPKEKSLISVSVIPRRTITLSRDHDEVKRELTELEANQGLIEHLIKKIGDPEEQGKIYKALTKAQSALVHLHLRGKEKEPIIEKLERNLKEYKIVRDLEIRIERPDWGRIRAKDSSSLMLRPSSDRLILGVDYVIDEEAARQALEKLVNYFS